MNLWILLAGKYECTLSYKIYLIRIIISTTFNNIIYFLHIILFHNYNFYSANKFNNVNCKLFEFYTSFIIKDFIIYLCFTINYIDNFKVKTFDTVPHNF
jgi:hypothetical protein